MRIFVSHRWDDGNAHAELAYRELLPCCSQIRRLLKWDWVYVDFRQPEIRQIGADVDEHLETCDVVVVLVGPNWSQRLADARDWVRFEVHYALTHKKVLVPVLIDGENDMPTEAELGELAGMLAWNHVTVRRDCPEDWSKVVRAIRSLNGCVVLHWATQALCGLAIFALCFGFDPMQLWRLNTTLAVDHVTLEQPRRALRPLPNPQQIASVEVRVKRILVRPCGTSAECEWPRKTIDARSVLPVVARLAPAGGAKFTSIHPLRLRPGDRLETCTLYATTGADAAVRMGFVADPNAATGAPGVSNHCSSDVEVTVDGPLHISRLPFAKGDSDPTASDASLFLDGAPKTVYLTADAGDWAEITYRSTDQRVWDSEIPVKAVQARLVNGFRIPWSNCAGSAHDLLRIEGRLTVESLDLSTKTLSLTLSGPRWRAGLLDENARGFICRGIAGTIRWLLPWPAIGAVGVGGAILSWLFNKRICRPRARGARRRRVDGAGSATV